MKTKTIGTLFLAATLSVAGLSYAVAGNQQGKADQQGMNGDQNCSMYSENGKGKHHGKMKHKRMGFAQLDLSDEQKQEMRAIKTASKSENKRQKNDAERLANQAEMQALMHSATFDEEKAQALISKQQTKKSEKKLAMLKTKHQMFQLLTDEQKAQYAELKMQQKNR